MERFINALAFLKRDAGAEIACWDESTKCFKPKANAVELRYEIDVLEYFLNELPVYKEFLNSLDTLLKSLKDDV